MSEITAIGVFEDRQRAIAAVEALRRADFAEKEVGLVSRHDKKSDRSAHERIDEPRSAGDEAVAGVGAAAGAMTGLGTGLALMTGLIPGVGPVVAGGVLTLLLSGTGAAAGSLLGGLFGMGVPHDEAKLYESELAAGRTLVTVHSGKRSAEALAILAQHGAIDRTVDVGPRS